MSEWVGSLLTGGQLIRDRRGRIARAWQEQMIRAGIRQSALAGRFHIQSEFQLIALTRSVQVDLNCIRVSDDLAGLPLECRQRTLLRLGVKLSPCFTVGVDGVNEDRIVVINGTQGLPNRIDAHGRAVLEGSYDPIVEERDLVSSKDRDSWASGCNIVNIARREVAVACDHGQRNEKRQ